jgi:hypothetical protein
MTTPAEISKLHMEILSELSSNSIKYYIPDNCHLWLALFWPVAVS